MLGGEGLERRIRLYIDDWLINSGITGLCNILAHSEDEFEIRDNYLEFETSVLEGFEDKYFNYFIDTYERNLSWYKIVSFEEKINYYNDSNFEGFNEKNLEFLNKYITDIFKKFIKSNSYTAAFELLGTKEKMASLEKNLSAIKLKKTQTIEELTSDVKDTLRIIEEGIRYLKHPEVKKYVAAKNVIYSVINKGWNGVSFLNRQTKEKNMYKDYKDYFVKPAVSYCNEDKAKYKYECFACGSRMKDMKNDLGFLNEIGFDVNRKASHVWNFNNDVAVCPLCRLVYSCVPAGFSYAVDSGMYVNDNHSVEGAVRINNKIKKEVLKVMDINRSLTYRALMESIKEQASEGIKYELSDIQVVRYVNEKYRFNILSRNILELINQSNNSVSKLISAGYKEINTYFSIYDMVLDNLFNTQNMYLLMHKMLLYKLTNSKNCYYNISQILSVMNINFNFMRGLGYMDKLSKDIVEQGNRQGYYLRLAYKNKDPKTSKLSSISYRLLNSLKVNDVNMFMDTVLNCYLYVKKPVPEILLKMLKDEDAFKTIGYAFVSGLIDGQENIKTMEGKNNAE